MVPRFSLAQRIAHWAFTAAFVALTVTGIFLLEDVLSTLAAGGISRMVHRVAAVLFMLTPVFYYVFDRKGFRRLISDSFSYDRDDLRWLLAFPRYLFGRVKGMPPQGRINAGEKLHHAVIVFTFLSISLSGLLLWVGKPALGPSLFGWTVIVHDVSMFVMVLLTIGHLYFVFVYGALRGMVSGWVTREYAAMEHAKWLAELDFARGGKSHEGVHTPFPAKDRSDDERIGGGRAVSGHEKVAGGRQ